MQQLLSVMLPPHGNPLLKRDNVSEELLPIYRKIEYGALRPDPNDPPLLDVRPLLRSPTFFPSFLALG
jgi:hypothetical protein